MRLKGREKINLNYTIEDMVTPELMCNAINRAFEIHNINKIEIDYLINYYKGIQPILTKSKPIREEINNKVVVNHAQMATRTINGYFLGTPIQYIHSGYTGNKELLDELNRFIQYEDKATVDNALGEYQSICGTAYRIIYRDGEPADDVPFEDRVLNPSSTFVVYENNISENAILGVTYYNVYDNDGMFVGYKIYAYTRFGMYELLTDDTKVASVDKIQAFHEYKVEELPIIEYPNNLWRIGDWELVMDVMNAINDLQSGRLDDIDQIIQSLIVFINADIDSNTYDEMREKGVVMLKNMTGNQSSVQTITSTLDQSGMNLFSKELEDLLYTLIGIPNRNSRSGGGDTGQAVELRDGWADLEIIARNKENMFKKSERKTLKVILEMFNLNKTSKLNLLDIDIKFNRNKTNNLLIKTQSYQSLLSTKTLAPADCLTIADLVSDVNEYVARGELYWKDKIEDGLDESNDGNGTKIVLENDNIE